MFTLAITTILVCQSGADAEQGNFDSTLNFHYYHQFDSSIVHPAEM